MRTNTETITSEVLKMSDEKEIRKVNNYAIKQFFQIGGKEIVIGEDMNAENANYYVVADYECNELFERYINAEYSNDYLEVATIFTDRVKAEIDRLQIEMKDYPLDFITKDKCMDISGKDLEGEIVVVRQQTFYPEYRKGHYQIGLCTGGNGAKPNGIGTGVYIRSFIDNEQEKFRRANILGILKPERYPEWLKDKLAMIEAIKNNPAAFEYGNVHFVPVGVVNDSFEKLSKNIESDMKLGMWSVNYHGHNEICKRNYSRIGFYEACGNIKCDIFKCLENGKNYIPGENEMFLYNGKFKDYDANKAKVKKHKEVER